MRSYIKCILLAVLWGSLFSLIFWGRDEVLYFSDIVLEFGMSDYEMYMSDIINISLRLFPFFLFQVLFGTHIYKHFCTASIYYFSRCENRVRWFLKESILLLPITVIYTMLLVMSGVGIATMNQRVLFDRESFVLFFYYFCIHSMWLYFTTLLVNVLAIKFDSSASFTVVSWMQLGCTSLLLLWDKVLPVNHGSEIIRNSKLLQLNPIAHLMIMWHSSNDALVDKRINIFIIDFNLNKSVLLMLILSFLIILIGCGVIKRHELLIANKETGGAE